LDTPSRVRSRGWCEEAHAGFRFGEFGRDRFSAAGAQRRAA
jgi:hypothetical protein